MAKSITTQAWDAMAKSITTQAWDAMALAAIILVDAQQQNLPADVLDECWETYRTRRRTWSRATERKRRVTFQPEPLPPRLTA